MKRILFILLFFSIGVNALLLNSQKVSADIAGLKAAIISAVAANLNATQRQEVSNSFITAYASEWQARLRSGTVDNAANRADFAASKVIDYVQDVRKGEIRKSAINALPTPNPIP